MNPEISENESIHKFKLKKIEFKLSKIFISINGTNNNDDGIAI
jgi:hypothetical protein